MKCNEIKEILMRKLYEKSPSIFCTNFEGMGFSEADVLRITESNVVYEYEIKTSVQDFKRDFKKEYKHERLSGKKNFDKYIEWSGHPGIPNHFYYVMPKDMVSLSQIPQYAGLIYVVEDDIEIIKKAPKIHSFKATEKLIRTVCKILSARFVFDGCSFMRFKQTKNPPNSN